MARQLQLIETLMKHIFAILLLLTGILAAAENAVTLSLSRFDNPEKSLNLNGHWKYQSGDNPAWAAADYDDSKWQEGASGLLFGKGLEKMNWNGSGWFRVRLKADTGILNRELSLTMLQSCASEVFLDGEKIFEVGTIGHSEVDQGCKITWGRMYLYPTTFSDTNTHLLAVRYSYFDFNRSIKDLFPAGFRIQIGDFDKVAAFSGNRLVQQSGIRWLFTGVPLAFALLHLLLVLFYPKARANLYYAIFTISAAGLTFNIMGSWLNTDMQSYLLSIFLFKISLLVLYISGLQFLYTNFYAKLPLQYWGFLSVTFIMLLFSWSIGVRAVYIFGFVSLIEEIRVIITAVRKKKEGARIIFFGYTICILGCTYQMLMGFGLCPAPSGIFQYPYLWGFMGMMISMSVYLARSIAVTNRRLEKATIEQKNTITQLESEMAERQRAELLTRQQQEKLIQADKMASIGILVSGVGHEINNPNNYMLLNSNNLADIWTDIRPMLDKVCDEKGDFEIAGLPYTEMREEIPVLISGISEGSERIRKIVQSLKDFARKDSGSMEQTVDINKVIMSGIVILSNLIKKSTDYFQVEYGSGLPAVRGNAQQIEQVIINLITNACHAIPDKTKSLNMKTAIVENHVKISIKDEGKGIDSEQMKHIMDPFFTTKRDTGGTGLGLSISYSIIKAHKGELTFHSEAGKGTEVVISLPIATI